MKNKRNLCGRLTAFAALLLLTLFAWRLPVAAEEAGGYRDLCVQSEDGETMRHFRVAEETSDALFAPAANGKAPTYVAYKTGDKTVNVLLNFLSYENDTRYSFTAQEIADIVAEYKRDLANYFAVISQHYLTVNIDYIVGTAPESYDSYKARTSPNSTAEFLAFGNSLANCFDEKGQTKEVAFDSFQIRINLFAGKASTWNTFLWPHAYTSSGLILVMEDRHEAATVSHEMLHVFGLPDLYAYTGSQTVGVGYLDIMGSTTKNNNLIAYYKQKAGWISDSAYDDGETTPIEVLDADDINGQDLRLYPSFTDSGDYTIAYRFGENPDTHEFFVVEYRVKNYKGTYDANLHYSRSIVIYRVDPRAHGNSNGNDPNGRVGILYMGTNTLSVNTNSYLYTAEIQSGSYGGEEMSTRALVYSSGSGIGNLFNGKLLRFRLNVKEMTADYATISIDYFDYFHVTPTAGENGTLSITEPTKVNGREDLTVTFTADEGNTVNSITVDGKRIPDEELIEAIKKGSYTFEHVLKDHTINVTFGKLYFALSFNLVSGTLENAPDKYAYGEGITLPIPTRENYQFLGWALKRTDTTYVEKIGPEEYGDKRFLARWQIITYDITATASGDGALSVEKTNTVKSGSDFTFSFLPENGKTLTSLKIDGTTVGIDELIGYIASGAYTFTNVKSAHTVEAIFGVLSFPLCYTLGGGEFAQTPADSYVYGEGLVLPIPSRLDYDFLGWSETPDGEDYVSSLSATDYGDKTLYACWAIGAKPVTCSVYGEGGALSVNGRIDVEVGGSLRVEFLPDGDNTLTSLMIDGAAVGLDELIACIRNGFYLFEKVRNPHTLEATFGTLTFGVQYELDGGEFDTVPALSYVYTVGTALPTPVKSRFAFRGWTLTAGGDDFVDAVDADDYGDKIFCASWERVAYEVKCTAVGAGTLSSVGETLVPLGEDFPVTLLPERGNGLIALTVDGRKMTGGELYPFLESGVYTFADIQSAHTLTAEFGILRFPITYTTDGGFFDEIVDSYVYDETTLLPVAYRLGYTLIGWSETPDGDGTVRGITGKEYGEKHFYAKWQKADYEVADGCLVFSVSENDVDVSPMALLCRRFAKDLRVRFANGITVGIPVRYLGKLSDRDPWMLRTGLEKISGGFGTTEYHVFAEADSFVGSLADMTAELPEAVMFMEVRHESDGSIVDYQSGENRRIIAFREGFGRYVVCQDNEKTTTLARGVAGVAGVTAVFVLSSWVFRKRRR